MNLQLLQALKNSICSKLFDYRKIKKILRKRGTNRLVADICDSIA